MSLVAIARLNDCPILLQFSAANADMLEAGIKDQLITGFRILDTVTGVYRDMEDRAIRIGMDRNIFNISNLCIENNKICGRGVSIDSLAQLGSTKENDIERLYVLQQLTQDKYIAVASNGVVMPLQITISHINSVLPLANAKVVSKNNKAALIGIDGKPITNVDGIDTTYIDQCNLKLKVLEAPYEITYNRGIRITNSAIEKLAIADYVTQITDHTFVNCYKLRRIKLPKNLIKIDRLAFAGCDSLEYIKIPDGVEIMFKSAFSSCKSLKRIDISPDCKLLEY